MERSQKHVNNNSLKLNMYNLSPSLMVTVLLLHLQTNPYLQRPKQKEGTEKRTKHKVPLLTTQKA